MTDSRFVPLTDRYAPDASPEDAARAFYEVMRRRRTVREYSDRPVSRETIEWILRAAGSAPSGANKQPWRFVCVQDPDTKRRIRETPDVKHPLVNVNPSTGRKALFIDPKTVTGVDGLPEDEANDLLDRLLAHTIRPENVYDHDWQPGDLVLWDNAVVLHKRESFPSENSRLVKRMILKLDPAEHIIPPVVQ